MDKSLEKLNLPRLAAYALAFIALCGGLLYFLINPLIKDYQAAQVELVAQIQSNLIAKNALDESTARLNALKAENATLLAQLDRDFNLTNFVNFLANYFKSASFSEILGNENSKGGANSVNFVNSASGVDAENSGDSVNLANSNGNTNSNSDNANSSTNSVNSNDSVNSNANSGAKAYSGSFERKNGKLNAQLFEVSGTKSEDLGANYLQYELNATARLAHPKKFYEFINALKGYEKLVKIEAPLEFSSRKDGDITANFRLKIYSTKAYNEKNSQNSANSQR